MRYKISIHKYVIEAVIHLAFWVGVYYVLNSLLASSFSFVVYRNDKPSGGFSAHMMFPYGNWVLGILMLLFYGNIFWLFKRLVRPKKNLVVMLAIAGWIALLFITNYVVIRIQAGPPFNNVDNAMRTMVPDHEKITFSIDSVVVRKTDTARSAPRFIRFPDPPPLPPQNMRFSRDDWWSMQIVMAIIFLAVLGISVAYFFIKEWIRNDISRNQLEAYQLNTEVKFLKSQINPHFLFNTLNNLFSMAQAKGNDGLADGISKLSGMMRYMIYDSNAPAVPLKKEIEYLEDCIVLNKLRYADDEVKVIFNYPIQPGNVTIAPMLFIPFVENAFKHGVSIGHKSEIDIDINVTGLKLIFTCVNTNYNAIKKMDMEKSGIGLENVKRRLGLLYPGKHSLQINDNDDGKYSVWLEIDME